MNKVRQLNNKGINAFRSYLEDIRDGVLKDIPSNFLKNNKFSKVINNEVYLNKIEFDNKFEMAKYLNNNIVEDEYIKNSWSNVGLWSWLSVLFFDKICPEINGSRSPGEDYRYILEVSKVGGGWSRFYRHLIASPVRLYSFHFDNSRVLLSSGFHQSGDLIETFASRREMAGNHTIIRVLNKLYFDSEKNRVKKGSTSYRKPGTHRRYQSILDQLGLTYDIQSMTSDDLIALLPNEFNKWIN